MAQTTSLPQIIENSDLDLAMAPITAGGKFLFAGGRKFYIKGVSYGAFRPNEAKEEYFDRGQLRRDFEMMADAGFNTVRIPHTMPPRAFARHRSGLRTSRDGGPIRRAVCRLSD